MFRFLRPRLLLLALPVFILAMISLGSNRGLAESKSPETCRNYLTDADLASRFTNELPVPTDLKPNVLNAVSPTYVLQAQEYIWRPAAGVCITKWGYQGATPGPTIRTAPHQQVELLVYNQLPGIIYNPYIDPANPMALVPAPNPTGAKYYSTFGPNPTPPPAPFDRRPYAQSTYELDPQLTLHLHGGHQVPTYDGDPMDTFPPGRSKMYVYPNNQEATTLWYHDHDMDHTRGHVVAGLAGFYLIEDPTDAQLGLPTGKYDIPVMFQRVPDEMLDQKNPNRPIWTVNNTLAPFYEVTTRPYRFRFLNGNDETPLNLFMAATKDSETPSQQVPLQQVGTDGGLMNFVSKKQPVRLFPAERADVVIDFSGITTPTHFYLQAAAAPAFEGDKTDRTAQSVVDFWVKPALSNSPKFDPAGGLLRPTNQITKLPTGGVVKRIFDLSFHDGGPPFATINDQFYDEHRVDASPQLGATEIWTFVNKTDDYHPMHMHDIEFQVISRTDRYGQPTEMQPGDWGSETLAWKDVFVVPPMGRMSVIGKFDDNLGVYVFHCHNLFHEDGGMMGQFQVVEHGAATVPMPPKSHMGH